MQLRSSSANLCSIQSYHFRTRTVVKQCIAHLTTHCISLSCCPSHRDGKSKSAELGRRAAVLSSAPRSILSMGVNSPRFLLSDSWDSGFVPLLLKSSFSFSIIQLSHVRLILNTSAWRYFLRVLRAIQTLSIFSHFPVYTKLLPNTGTDNSAADAQRLTVIL